LETLEKDVRLGDDTLDVYPELPGNTCREGKSWLDIFAYQSRRDAPYTTQPHGVSRTKSNGPIHQGPDNSATPATTISDTCLQTARAKNEIDQP